ncbi:MAG: hypothetical protein KDK39_12240 [Leptospiraceae bacterium]|nr:hypothetical protein [Leptospiraceae bacterium]
MPNSKAISIPIKDIAQLKVVLAAWYAFLREADQLSHQELTDSLKTPVIYDIEKDKVELLFTGSAALLESFRSHINKS